MYRFYQTFFLLCITLPALQYLQFLNILPKFNIMPIYIVGLLIVLLRSALEWLAGKHRIIRSNTLWAGSTLILIVVQQLVWLPDFMQIGAGNIFIENFALTAVIPLAFLLIGIRTVNCLPSPRGYLPSFLVYALAVALGVWSNIQETSLTIIKFVNYQTGERFNYLNLADGFALLAILLLTRLSARPLLYFPTLIICVGILLSTFSRSSLLLFVLVSTLQILLNQQLRLVGVIIISMLTGLVFSFLASIQSSQNFIRVSSLLSSPETDSSFLGRSDIASNRLSDLAHHFWTGQYMAEWWTQGERGGYLHNILSYLDSYGVITFCVLLFLLLRIAFVSWRIRLDVSMVFLFALTSVLFSRAYIWPYLWLAIGLVVGASSSIWSTNMKWQGVIVERVSGREVST